MFKLGFSTLGCPSYDVGQVIALARDNRFGGVELRFLRGEVDLPKLEELSPARVRETRRRFEDAGIQVVCIARGVTTLLETHDAFATSDRVLDLFARGAGGALGVLWDTLHTYRHGEPGAETWSRLGRYIKHVHLKDAADPSAKGFRPVLTGDGAVRIPSFLDVLRGAEYGGYVLFEWEKAWYPDIAEPDVAIPHFARYISRWL